MSMFKQKNSLSSSTPESNSQFIHPAPQQETDKKDGANPGGNLNHFGEPEFIQPQSTIQAKLNGSQNGLNAGNNIKVSPTPSPVIQLKKETLKERLDRIEKTYKAMIKASRKKGHNVAADNLQRFIDGTGGTKIESVKWLRSFSAITSAEEVNEERFEASLSKAALKLGKGKTTTHKDHWDRQLTASIFTELYYASGTSSIKSTGSFTLTRKGDTITITGSVSHKWWDPYDWHAGLGAYVPGFGRISDKDALLLQKHRGAKPFKMEATWTRKLSGTYKIDNFLYFDSETYNWTGP